MVYLINDETLTSIADAIREKTGTSESIDPVDMPALILGIKSGDGIGYKAIPSEDLFFANATGNLIDVGCPVLGIDMPMQLMEGTYKVITVSVVEG